MLVNVQYGNAVNAVHTKVDNPESMFPPDVLINISDNFTNAFVDNHKITRYCQTYVTPILDHILHHSINSTYVILDIQTNNYHTYVKLDQLPYGRKININEDTSHAYAVNFHTDLNTSAGLFIIPKGQEDGLLFKMSFKVKGNIFTCVVPHGANKLNTINLADVYAIIKEGLIKSYLPLYCKTTMMPILEKVLKSNRAYSCSLFIKYEQYTVCVKLFKRFRGIASISGKKCAKYKLHLKHHLKSANGYVGGVTVKEFL